MTFSTGGREIPAVRDVSALFEAGKVTGLIGESGSGKSVLGMSVLQLLPGTAKVEGTCLYHGINLYALKEKEMQQIRGKDISLIPQNPTESLNPAFKIKRQLVEAMTVHNKKAKTKAEERSRKLLRRFGFDRPEDVTGKYTFQLSGGMNQRVVSVLGLMNHPQWIIADEPTKGLDAILRKQVYQVLKGMIQEDHVNMLVITHDIMLAEKLCDRLMVLYQGVILEQGNTADIIENPKHPYTIGLIGSLPGRGMNPIPLPKEELMERQNGCPFYSRCTCAMDRCKENLPEEYRQEDSRIVRCFLYDRSNQSE